MDQSKTEAIEELRHIIQVAEQNLQSLKDSLAALELQETPTNSSEETLVGHANIHPETTLDTSTTSAMFETSDFEEYKIYGKHTIPGTLDTEEYKRYGRQMILPDFGLEGQLKLSIARVLIIGVGGLGCPAATYLAGAGLGRIGLMDGDVVELSNLHRQIVHTTGSIGRKKVDSAVKYLRKLNPNPTYKPYPFRLTPTNCLHIFQEYDVILDCTDNPQSRYLISDACVLSKKLLITASATQTDGQLMTLGNKWKGSPCYRCVFPKPPPPNMVQSCSESGVLGPAVGVMGVLMAVEAIKTISQFLKWDDDEPNARQWCDRTVSPTLLLYSAYATIPFRTTYLKKPRKDCVACSSKASITRESLESGSMDYGIFCGITEPVNIIPDTFRLSAQDFDTKVRRRKRHILVDVREEQDFNMCHIKESFSLPYSAIAKCIEDPQIIHEDDIGLFHLPEKMQRNVLRISKLTRLIDAQKEKPELYFICRYGNDSQKAVQFFLDETDHPWSSYISVGTVQVMDIKGGLRAWSREVDPKFPEY